MAEVAEQTKIALAAFSCFTWQCDVVNEISAREAEAFFAALETHQTDAAVEAARSELLRKRVPTSPLDSSSAWR